MNKLKIEKNIPIPARNARFLNAELEQTLSVLEDGDSFVVIGNAARYKVLTRMRKLNMLCACRCIGKPNKQNSSTYEYRIWKKPNSNKGN